MATQMAVQGRGEIAQSPKDVRQLIMSEAFQSQVKKAMPGKMSSDILLRVAVTTIQKTPKLLECSQQSLMQCVLECAQLGLLPDGILGQAYLVPYAKVATLQIGYKGLLVLARRSGEIKYVVAEPVYAGDQFRIAFAPERTIHHLPDIDDERRGEKVDGKYLPAGFRGVYALVRYKDDTVDFEYLPLHKVERIRASSQAGNKADGPWLNHFEEMAKKTAIRALAKRLPLSADDMRRVVADEYRDAGVDVDVDYSPNEAVKQIVADAEIDALTGRLGWNETRKNMARLNFADNRDAHIAHLKTELGKMGPPYREQVVEREAAAQTSAAADADEYIVDQRSKPFEDDPDQGDPPPEAEPARPAASESRPARPPQTATGRSAKW